MSGVGHEDVGYKEGDVVVAVALTTHANLNGSVGAVVGLDQTSQRYMVRFAELEDPAVQQSWTSDDFFGVEKGQKRRKIV